MLFARHFFLHVLYNEVLQRFITLFTNVLKLVFRKLLFIV